MLPKFCTLVCTDKHYTEVTVGEETEAAVERLTELGAVTTSNRTSPGGMDKEVDWVRFQLAILKHQIIQGLTSVIAKWTD